MGQFVPAKGIVAVMRKLAGPVLVAAIVGSLSLAAPADAASKHHHRHHHKAHRHHHRKAPKVHRTVVKVAPVVAAPTYPPLPNQGPCVMSHPYAIPELGGVYLVCI